MNFARDVLESQPPGGTALVELSRDGVRREWSFAEIELCSAQMAGALGEQGVRRGDVVVTLIGNRPEWVCTLIACFRIGAVALPCTEQLRAKDLRLRFAVARPALIVADERNRAELEATAPDCEAMWVGSEGLWGDGSKRGCPTRARGASHFEHPTPKPPTPAPAPGSAPSPLGPTSGSDPRARELGAVRRQGPESSHVERELDNSEDTAAKPPPSGPPPYMELAEDDPALITFTSGTAGEPKAVVHAQRYLYGQRVQAEHWLGAERGDLVWCTAASGWSKSARNVFVAPWLMGASALLHDARFDPDERLDLIERERVSILCMAPTEYRVIAKRASLRRLPSLKGMVAAGEALNPEVLKVWRDATGLEIRDGYGQTETGQMTGMAIGTPAREGSMGRALEGVRLSVVEGELVADPSSVPTFFLGYLGDGVERDRDGGWRIEDRQAGGPWRTGDQVREDEDGYLCFEGRADDVIISAGYRIGPFEVESALVAHPAVAEAAAVAARDEERGAVVRAIVVLRDGHDPSEELARELQEHAKRETAPYKYPRIVEFADELPKTASGKIMRAALRDR